jgi:transposase
MHPKYFQVIELRKEGKSYRELAKIVGASKNSVSRWCKNLKLPPSAKRILEEKNKKNKKALEEHNRFKSVHSRQKFYQIKGWIDGLIKQT